MPLETTEVYLGDGVYATFDGEYYIRLDLRMQDNTTQIALEPEVFQRLVEFQKRCFPSLEKK